MREFQQLTYRRFNFVCSSAIESKNSLLSFTVYVAYIDSQLQLLNNLLKSKKVFFLTAKYLFTVS